MAKKKLDALQILSAIGATFTQDSDTLSSSQMGELLEFADIEGYRKPKNANGSRGRYYFAQIQRRAIRQADAIRNVHADIFTSSGKAK